MSSSGDDSHRPLSEDRSTLVEKKRPHKRRKVKKRDQGLQGLPLPQHKRINGLSERRAKEVEKRRLKLPASLRADLPSQELLAHINRTVHERILHAQDWPRQNTLRRSALLSVGILAQEAVQEEFRHALANGLDSLPRLHSQSAYEGTKNLKKGRKKKQVYQSTEFISDSDVESNAENSEDSGGERISGEGGDGSGSEGLDWGDMEGAEETEPGGMAWPESGEECARDNDVSGLR